MLQRTKSTLISDPFWRHLIHAAQVWSDHLSQDDIQKHLKRLYLTQELNKETPSEIISFYETVSEQYFQHGIHN